MALTFVGGTTGGSIGSNGSNLTISLTSLTGGISNSPSEGDIVIVSYAKGSKNRNSNLYPVTTGYTRHCNLYSDSTYDTNLFVATKIMSSTPDTSVVLPPSGYTDDALVANIKVWRASSGPILVEQIETATGQNYGRPTPPAITPTKQTSIIVCGGAYSDVSSNALTSSDLSNFTSVSQADDNDITLGVGSYSWTSGTFTPAQFGGGNTSSTFDSWCAFSLNIYEESIGTNTQINIGDTWKTIESIKINIGDTWKDVSNASLNMGDTWKTIF